MKLFFTKDDFRVNGIPRPGIPFLCDGRMELVDTPNRYLRYIATVRGRTQSPATWRTYGDHLLEFFAFLEENDIQLSHVTIQILAAWRDSMLERHCSRNTVNQRLRGVHAFYEWAKRNGILSVVPFSTQDIRVAHETTFLAHLAASGNQMKVNELTLRAADTIPQFLRLDKAIRFIEALTPTRVRLMGYLMLATGMRRAEVVALDYRALPNPAGNDPDKALPMTLDGETTPTKGSKSRVVMLPFDLAVALVNYLTFERHQVLKKLRGKSRQETTRLFLSRFGEELSVKSLNHAFTQATRRTGIACHPHMLRHTYGTYELLRMRHKHGESQALLWVRERMGHSSISITERYIHAAHLIPHDALDGYQRDLCQVLRDGYPPLQA